MSNKRAINYDEFEAKLLEKPEIRKEYEALKPKYELIRSLIKRRAQMRISQTELARIIGTKQPAISRLEKGDYNTTLSTFFKVADALNLDVSLKTRKTARQTRLAEESAKLEQASERAMADEGHSPPRE